MANDVGALCSLIITDLARNDTSLSDVLLPYIQSSIIDYEADRFHFNEKNLTLTISVTNTYSFSLWSMVGNGISEIVEVDRFGITVNTTRSYELTETDWSTINDIDSGPGTLQGYPQVYAVQAQAIRVWPLPNTTMTGQVSAHIKFNQLTSMSDINSWTEIGRNLIRYATLKRFVGGRLRDFTAAQAFEHQEMLALQQLKRRNDAISGHIIRSSGL